MSKEFREPELGRHLQPVNAPEELWDRVENPRESPAVRTPHPWTTRLAWAAAAAVIVTGAIWTMRLRNDANLTNEALAVEALLRGPVQLDYRSGEAPQVRSWIKNGTGLDVPLPGRTAASVQLIGAKRVLRKGVPTATISYRVGDQDATLVISKMAPGGEMKHTFLGTGSMKGANYLSWTMHGQSYTVASADARVACLLCHIGGSPPEILN